MSRILVLIQDFATGKGEPAVQVASLHGRDLAEAMGQPWPPDCCYRRITEIPGIASLDGLLPGAIWEQRGPQEPWIAVPAVPAGE